MGGGLLRSWYLTIGFCVTDILERRRPLATKLCGTPDVFKAERGTLRKEDELEMRSLYMHVKTFLYYSESLYNAAVPNLYIYLFIYNHG
jgi:hypothetical protein